MTKENIIGDRIKELRKAKNLTQEQLGEILGVQKAAVLKYEKGYVQNLKRSTIEKLANLFEVSIDYLLGLNKEIEVKDDIISKYNLNEMELAEYNKIMNMNMLMFNDKEISDEDKVILEKTLKEIFVKSLLKKRAKEAADKDKE